MNLPTYSTQVAKVSRTRKTFLQLTVQRSGPLALVARKYFAIYLAAIILLTAVRVDASPPVTIDFEGLSDLTPVTTQYPNLVFANATEITAGISLNEFDFPPHSGTNVVFDDGGPMAITFSAPVSGFGGYFTCNTQITLIAFDAANAEVATRTSAETGGSPNEFLSLNFAGGITRITIRGDPSGSSFTLDDVTVTQLVNDTTPPTCLPTALRPGPAAQVEITAQDTGSGLAAINVLESTNANVSVQTFSVGTTAPVVITVTNTDPGRFVTLKLVILDVSGNITRCNQALATVSRDTGQPVSQTLTAIPQSQNRVMIHNSNPGLTNMSITVNGRKFQLGGLRDDEIRTLDVSSAMAAGNNNSISLKAEGRPGGVAAVLIHD